MKNEDKEEKIGQALEMWMEVCLKAADGDPESIKLLDKLPLTNIDGSEGDL